LGAGTSADTLIKVAIGQPGLLQVGGHRRRETRLRRTRPAAAGTVASGGLMAEHLAGFPDDLLAGQVQAWVRATWEVLLSGKSAVC